MEVTLSEMLYSRSQKVNDFKFFVMLEKLFLIKIYYIYLYI